MGASLATSSGKQPKPDINVTPLVDVVLVLLIIFMVVTPALNEGEHVELPAIEKPDPKPKDLNPIKLTLAANGRIIVDDVPVAKAELRSRLRALHEEDPERALLLNSDETLPYKQVRDTFASLQDLGFKGVSLKVTELKQRNDS